MSVNDYDRFALAYDADTEQNAFNGLYERPAILALAGDVDGLEVLDAGCGGGLHSVALLEGGARVSGFDKSRSLLAIARKRLGADAELVEADFSEPLPFASGRFDVVLSALALHYVEDWAKPLGEFHRVLKPGGRVVFSTHHPFLDHQLAGGDNYFAVYQFEDLWVRDGQQMHMQFWHRPLTAMVASVKAAGFVLEDIVEPQPLEEARVRFPKDFEKLSTAPRFLFFAARRP